MIDPRPLLPPEYLDWDLDPIRCSRVFRPSQAKSKTVRNGGLGCHQVRPNNNSSLLRTTHLTLDERSGEGPSATRREIDT